jgi:prolyl-tRNA synthetase
MVVSYSRYFPQTRRTHSKEDGSDGGYALLERAGFIRSGGASGVHSLLPLGWRVHRKVCDVIFEVMERHGVLNLTLPILQSRELWEQSGRWDAYVSSQTMFRTRDEHKGTEFGLAPTAEEMVTALVAGDVKSWRELPLYLHQIGPKFRDEIRPRGGLLRGREFSMSDAYSFDRDEEGMRESFELFRKIYAEIFERLGLEKVISVQADSGAIGGTGSAEFMAVNDAGEDTLLTCDTCEYGANAEKAEGRYPGRENDEEPRESRRVPTPDIRTVEQLQASFPDIDATQMIKTLLFAVDGEDERFLVAVCIRGDLEVNEVKLSNEVGYPVAPASAVEIEQATGAPPGFAGPIGLRGARTIYFDRSAEGMRNFLCGGNEEDIHYLDVNFGRDVEQPSAYVDLHLATGGEGCPECEGTLTESRGIELGHVFMLQRGYAKALGATFSDENGHEQDMWMGCYGIGTTRLVQAIAEQWADADGLMWPRPVAPFDLHLVMTRPEDSSQREMLDKVVALADEFGQTALVDDRDASPGVKFKDADLIGCPFRVTIGRDAEAGKVELRDRSSGETHLVEVGDLQTLIGV